MRRFGLIGAMILLAFIMISPGSSEPLPGTESLTWDGDLAMRMVEGIDDYLMRAIQEAPVQRETYWHRDLASVESYLHSIEPNRQHLLSILGITDDRLPPHMELVTEIIQSGKEAKSAAFDPHLALGEGQGFTIYAVRWPVFRDVQGEGLLLLPKGKPLAWIVALQDCDADPERLLGVSSSLETSAFAKRLAENGCAVLVPTLVNRRDTYSGLEGFRFTNQPHREFIWRAAYEMGRTMIGYDVQKIMAAVDGFALQNRTLKDPLPIGVIGYGEGGLLAFYAAAADPRIPAAAVCGYFGPREQLWSEPIYRNTWSLLREFGDAEIASLIAPRTLIVEDSRQPAISGPPQTPNRSGAAPGAIRTFSFAEAESEATRARTLAPPGDWLLLMHNEDLPVSEATLAAFLESLTGRDRWKKAGKPVRMQRLIDIEARHKRQFDQLLMDTQALMRDSEFVRVKFWEKADAGSAEAWEKSAEWYRNYFWDEVVGRLPDKTLPPHPRSRLVYDQPNYRGYEVVLDVVPDVFAYGILLVPKNLQPGEKRPVVVCQHGLEGRPQDVADPQHENPYYHQYACRLADQGFITFAPQNPYIGEDKFRVLLRKGQPLHLTLYSFIVRQHDQILKWLAAQPFVDASRMAFYGLSYGGKTAMRVPALLTDYCLSICSADYNEWIWKNVSSRHHYSYLFTGEYDMAEWNLGNTFNYAELSGLIFPRPFMVERGHMDGVAPDEWVAYEYARTRRLYDLLDRGDRTQIEVFNGPHSIHGVGTFAFLHQHLHF